MKKKLLKSLAQLTTVVLFTNGNISAQVWSGTPNTVNTYTNSNVGISSASTPSPATNARLQIDNTLAHSLGPIEFQINRTYGGGTGMGVPPNYIDINDVAATNPSLFILDYLGQVGINNPNPKHKLDVIGNINGDGNLTISGSVGIGTSTLTDRLTIQDGDMTINKTNDFSNIFARANDYGLVLASNTNPSNGSCIQLFGANNSFLPGGMTFYSSGGPGVGWEFSNYNSGGYLTCMRIRNEGKVIIGKDILSNYPGNYNLYVQNGIITEKLKVANSNDPGNWADFVFNKDYKLLSLAKVESYVKENKHLPEIPSAKEVSKDGIDVAQMDAKLLQKIEELTLYAIQQQKQLEQQQKEIELLMQKIN